MTVNRPCRLAEIDKPLEVKIGYTRLAPTGPVKGSPRNSEQKKDYSGNAMILSDIINDIKGIDASPKKLRDFGITFFVVFALIGGLLLHKGRGAGYLSIGIGLLFLLGGIFAKSSLKVPYRLWMGFAVVLGFFMSRIILGILFYLVITPIGVALRLFGKDLLNERWDREVGSYWIKKEKRPFDKKRYEKLY